jgi:hypothetical protein
MARNKPKWIYWLKEPKSPHWIDYQGKGLSGAEWEEQFQVNPSALVAMRRAIINTKINSTGKRRYKTLEGTYAVLKDGLKVYVEMSGAFNLEKNKWFYSRNSRPIEKETIRRNSIKRYMEYFTSKKSSKELTIEEQRKLHKQEYRKKIKQATEVVIQDKPIVRSISREVRDAQLLLKYPKYKKIYKDIYTEEEKREYIKRKEKTEWEKELLQMKEEIRKEEEEKENSPREVIKVEPLPVQLTEEEIKVKKIKAIEEIERIRELMKKYPTPNNIENMKKDESDY